MPLHRSADGQLYSGSTSEMIGRLPTSSFRMALMTERAQQTTLSTSNRSDPSDSISSGVQIYADDLEEKLCEICQHAVSGVMKLRTVTPGHTYHFFTVRTG